MLLKPQVVNDDGTLKDIKITEKTKRAVHNNQPTGFNDRHYVEVPKAAIKALLELHKIG